MNRACISKWLQSSVYQTISDSIIIKIDGHKPEEFIDEKTGSSKYWINNEEKKLEIKQKIDRINNVFERVKKELQILYFIRRQSFN